MICCSSYRLLLLLSSCKVAAHSTSSPAAATRKLWFGLASANGRPLQVPTHPICGQLVEHSKHNSVPLACSTVRRLSCTFELADDCLQGSCSEVHISAVGVELA